MSKSSLRIESATHSYIGRKPCGCIVAARVDTGDKETGRDVAQFIREGLTIERVPHSEVTLDWDCPHHKAVEKPLQPRLFDEVQS